MSRNEGASIDEAVSRTASGENSAGLTIPQDQEWTEDCEHLREMLLLKGKENHNGSRAQSDPDGSQEDVPISASRKQDLTAYLHDDSACGALLRAQILNRPQQGAKNDSSALLDEIVSLLPSVDQRPLHAKRRCAFRKNVAPRDLVEVMHPESLLPALHSETRASLERYGVFPFERGQQVPWDSTFFFEGNVDMDGQGNGTYNMTNTWTMSYFFLFQIFDCILLQA